jgi:DnaJ-class molecular chaperone
LAVPFWLALAGGTREVETPWGPRVVQIPAGLEGGSLLRLAGLGVARRGDGFLRVALTWPGPLTRSEAEGLRAWGEAVAAREAAGRGR